MESWTFSHSNGTRTQFLTEITSRRIQVAQPWYLSLI